LIPVSAGRPLVSIALALYNGSRYFEEQMRSLLAQTYAPIEVVVVDDGSKDKSYEIAQGYAAQDSRVRVFRNENNLGLVHNFLKATGLCRGSYVCFSDQDDVWAPHKVDTLVRVMKGHPDNALVYSDLELAGARPRSFWAASGIRPRRGRMSGEILLRNLSPGCAMMFTRRVVDLIAQAYLDPSLRAANSADRLDDVIFMHDHLALTLAAAVGRIDYTAERLMTYRQHEGNSIGAFYPGMRGRERAIEGLRKKVHFLRAWPEAGRGLDLGRVEAFVQAAARPAFPSTLLWFGYYSRMRKDSLTEQVRALAECLFPVSYARWRQKALQ
jgi:glycosyltransferase involved in cell wall biosynthesis